MFKIGKKIFVLSILGVILVSSNALAGSNHGDTSMQMYGGNSENFASPQRKKLNDTSVYLKTTYQTNMKDNDYFDIKVKPGSDTNLFAQLSSAKIYRPNIGSAYRIQTLAYEVNRECYVKIVAETPFRLTYTYYAGTLWSPDSI